MAIEIQQPGLAGLYGRAAVISKQEAEARRIQEQQARKEEQQAEFEYRTALRQQDMAIDLEMNQRAKLWEIEKAEIASRADFMRKEQVRQRKLDSADNAIQQIDKEVLAGRMTEQEAYPLKLKYELNKMGVDAPTPLLPREQKVDPMKQLIQRFLTGDEVEGVPGTTGRIRVVSPEGQTGTIEARELEAFKARGFTVIGKAVEEAERKPVRKPMEIKTTPFTREFRGKF